MRRRGCGYENSLVAWGSAVRATLQIVGKPWAHSRQSLSILFFFLPDLTRVKFCSACPPLGRCYRALPPGQALPNFLPHGSPQPPLPYGSRLQAIGPIDLPLAGRSDGPLAPGFRGRCGRSDAAALAPLPTSFCALRFLAGFDPCQIRQRLPALGQVLPNFQPLISPQPPLPFAYTLGQSDRSTCHWQVAQTVLWHPVFAGG